MPTTLRQGVRLHWEIEGYGPPLLLLNSIGTDLHLWDRVMPHLDGYRVVRMDTRGHGQSDAPVGDYSLEMLAQDVLVVLDDAGLERVAIAGVSLGGMIAMELAFDHPERVAALLPICTSAKMDSAAWAARVATVRAGGTEAILELAMSRFLSPSFMQSEPEIAAQVADGLWRMADAGYAGCAAAIRDMDIYWRLGTLRLPTLVIAGDRDTSTPFETHGAHIMETIAGARATILHAAHLAPLEAPAELAAAITGFLDEVAVTSPMHSGEHS